MKNHTHRTDIKGIVNGFTLIELLVVITIIALLVSILMPALNKAKQQAYAVKCMAHQKGIGQAMMQHLAEHDDIYPLSYVYPNDPWDGINKKDKGTWSISKQPNGGGIETGDQNGYLHWSWFLMGNGSAVDPEFFECPGMKEGGAPPTYPVPGDEADGQMSNTTGFVDRQARRMAFTLNAALCPRNKINGSDYPKKFQLVKATKVKGATDTILATEFNKDWRLLTGNTDTAGDAPVKSHRPVTPFLSFSNQSASEAALLTASRTSFGYSYTCYQYQRRNDFGINPMDTIEMGTNNFDANPLNGLGRHHPGKYLTEDDNSVKQDYGGTTNFLFADGHVSRMHVIETIQKALWGRKFYSVTGDQSVMYPALLE